MLMFCVHFVNVMCESDFDEINAKLLNSYWIPCVKRLNVVGNVCNFCDPRDVNTSKSCNNRRHIGPHMKTTHIFICVFQRLVKSVYVFIAVVRAPNGAAEAKTQKHLTKQKNISWRIVA